jgi:hypothetical protein
MASITLNRKTLQKSPKSTESRNALHWLAGLLVLGGMGFGVLQATRSSIFQLKSVSVEPLSASYPLTQESVLELAKVPVGRVSLFDYNMEPVESRLTRNPWVKGVVLGKQFPNTLSLRIVERIPVALLTESNGRVLYLEQDGSTFEDRAMVYPKDLPILTGFSAQNLATLKSLNSFIGTWFSSEKLPGLKLSSLSYDERLGLKAMVVYPMKNQKQMRTVLELGLNLEEARGIPTAHLKQVLDYMSSRSTPASKIWLGDGKKIVVKFSRGS